MKPLISLRTGIHSWIIIMAESGAAIDLDLKHKFESFLRRQEDRGEVQNVFQLNEVSFSFQFSLRVAALHPVLTPALLLCVR